MARLKRYRGKGRHYAKPGELIPALGEPMDPRTCLGLFVGFPLCINVHSPATGSIVERSHGLLTKCVDDVYEVWACGQPVAELPGDYVINNIRG